jgi:hypothetical protein
MSYFNSHDVSLGSSVLVQKFKISSLARPTIASPLNYIHLSPGACALSLGGLSLRGIKRLLLLSLKTCLQGWPYGRVRHPKVNKALMGAGCIAIKRAADLSSPHSAGLLSSGTKPTSQAEKLLVAVLVGLIGCISSCLLLSHELTLRAGVLLGLPALLEELVDIALVVAERLLSSSSLIQCVHFPHKARPIPGLLIELPNRILDLLNVSSRLIRVGSWSVWHFALL